MIDQKESQSATAKDMEGIDWVGLNKMSDQWEREEKRLRQLYLESPRRKTFFQYDFVEALWFQLLEYYGVIVGDEAMESMLDDLTNDGRLLEIVYDIAEKYADSKGWEQK